MTQPVRSNARFWRSAAARLRWRVNLGTWLAGFLPVAIRGARSVMRSNQWFPRRGAVQVVVSAAITPDGDDFAAAVRLRDATRARILNFCGEPDLEQ